MVSVKFIIGILFEKSESIKVDKSLLFQTNEIEITFEPTFWLSFEAPDPLAWSWSYAVK